MRVIEERMVRFDGTLGEMDGKLEQLKVAIARIEANCKDRDLNQGGLWKCQISMLGGLSIYIQSLNVQNLTAKI